MTSTFLPFTLPRRLSQHLWLGIVGTGFMTWVAVTAWDPRELDLLVMVAFWFVIAPSTFRPAQLVHDGFRAGWRRRHVPFSEFAAFKLKRWTPTGIATLHSGKTISLSFAGINREERKAALRWIEQQIAVSIFA